MSNSLTCGPLNQRRLNKNQFLSHKLNKHHSLLKKFHKRCLLSKNLKLKLLFLKNKWKTSSFQSKKRRSLLVLLKSLSQQNLNQSSKSSLSQLSQWYKKNQKLLKQ